MRSRRSTSPHVMRARFPGTCSACGRPIAPGETIIAGGHVKARHADCAATAETTTTAPPERSVQRPGGALTSATTVGTGIDLCLFHDPVAMRALWTTRHQTEKWRSGDVGDVEARRLIEAGEAHPAARKAYEEMRNAIEAAVGARIQDRAVSAKRRRIFSEEGDEIDTARVASGDPDCWARRERLAKRRTFRLGLNLGISSSTGVHGFAAMAGACAAACDALQTRGYGVEVAPISVTLVEVGRARGRRVLCRFPNVKDAHAPLDVEALLCAGSPAYLRCVVFEGWELAGISSSYGNVVHPTDADRPHLGIDYCFSTIWSAMGELTQHADGFISALFGGTVDYEGRRAC